MGLSAYLGIASRGWQAEEAILRVAAIFAAGGLVAYIPVTMLAALLSRGRHREARLAIHGLGLACATAGTTALLYALVYRSYYAEWHDPAFTTTWFFEFGFTIAGAVYQFLVSGLGLYLPLGLAALFGFAWWNAREPR